MKLWIQNYLRDRRANALVEFSLAFPLLFITVTGVYQFGYTFYTYNALEAGVRAGARYAGLRTYDSTTSTPSTAFLTAVRNVVLYGDPNGGTRPVTPGITPDKVSLDVTMANGVPTQVTVSVSDFDVDAVVTKFHLTGKPWATFPYTGRLAR